VTPRIPILSILHRESYPSPSVRSETTELDDSNEASRGGSSTDTKKDKIKEMADAMQEEEKQLDALFEMQERLRVKRAKLMQLMQQQQQQ